MRRRARETFAARPPLDFPGFGALVDAVLGHDDAGLDAEALALVASGVGLHWVTLGDLRAYDALATDLREGGVVVLARTLGLDAEGVGGPTAAPGDALVLLRAAWEAEDEQDRQAAAAGHSRGSHGVARLEVGASGTKVGSRPNRSRPGRVRRAATGTSNSSPSKASSGKK